MSLFESGPEVYIEVDEGRLFIGRLEKKGKRFFCNVSDDMFLEDLAIKDGVLYNTSALYVKTKRFVDRHRLGGARALVCCPAIKGYGEDKKRLAVLQVSLSLCKAGLVIERFFDEKLLK